jgi:hypothetical protein
MNRLLHHVLGHRVGVFWRIHEDGTGWRYVCSCSKEWDR